jgi:folate-binding protein YgfZ
MAVWDGAPKDRFGLCYPDPRLSALGWRCMLAPHLADEAARAMGATLTDAAAYEAHRIALGVPRGGLDFTYGDVFPHETDMDQLAGVDFDKGCYIGQEVVSRMQHRANVRSRVVPIAFDDFAPEAGTPITADDKPVGTIGSSAQGRGLALVRLDRVADAMAAGVPLLSGGVPLRLAKPDWARFNWPGS